MDKETEPQRAEVRTYIPEEVSLPPFPDIKHYLWTKTN